MLTRLIRSRGIAISATLLSRSLSLSLSLSLPLSLVLLMARNSLDILAVTAGARCPRPFPIIVARVNRGEWRILLLSPSLFAVAFPMHPSRMLFSPETEGKNRNKPGDRAAALRGPQFVCLSVCLSLSLSHPFLYSLAYIRVGIRVHYRQPMGGTSRCSLDYSLELKVELSMRFYDPGTPGRDKKDCRSA